MGEQKKKFFRRPSLAEIRNNTNNREVKRDFWENLAELKDGESLTLIGNIFPYDFKFNEPNYFLKNGPVVTVPTKNIQNPLMLPFKVREETFDSLPKHRLRYAGFVFIPHFGVDKTPRLIRLNDILEAAKMYAYAPLSDEQIIFKSSAQIPEIYDSVDGVAEIGASFAVKIPSRTKGKGRYEMSVDHVPITDNAQKFEIAYMQKTNHVCKDKSHYKKFPTKSRPRFISEYVIDAHEIAASFAIIAHYTELAREQEKETGIRPKIIPLEMNLTGIPTEMFCRVYDNLIHRTLIKPTATADPITPREGHLEALLWEGMIKEGYRKCFFKENEGSLKDFKWTTYK
jgi:hypothetical protein